MARCPECRHSFSVLEDEDDGQHACPRCGYGEDRPDDLTPDELLELADAGFDLRNIHRAQRWGGR